MSSLLRFPSLFVNLFPSEGKTLVEPELFEHLVAFFAAEGSTLNQAVDAPVGEPVLVANFVKTCSDELVTIWIQGRFRVRLFEMNEFFDVDVHDFTLDQANGR